MKKTILLIVILFNAILFISGQSPAAELRGTVKTSDGKPAAMVSVVLKELKKGFVTDERGGYYFKGISAGRYTLVVSYVGLETVESQIEVQQKGVSIADFTLQESRNELEEIVIAAGYTANERTLLSGKSAIRLMDLPQAVTIINKEALERQQVLHISDALQQVNGVYLMGNTGGFQEEIAARGFSFSSANTFKNGVRFNNGIMPEMSSIEKLEFLKGGSAILFGNVAPGGIMNIITKKPRFEQGGELSFRTGSFGFYKPMLDIYSGLGKKQQVALRVNSTYEKANSFRDVVSSERYYINPSLLVRLSPKTEFLLQGDYLSDNRTPDYGIGAINYTIPDVPRSVFIGTSWAYNKVKQSTVNATMTHQFNARWQLTTVAGFQHYAGNLFAAARPNTNSNFIQATGTWIRGLQKSATEENYYLLQADLNGKFKTGNTEHTLLAGADADQYHTEARTFITTAYNNGLSNTSIRNKNIYDTINLFDPYGTMFTTRNDIPYLAPNLLTSSPVQRAGLYIQDLISVSGRFKMLAGIRYSVQQNRRATVDTLAKGTQGFIKAYTTDAFSPRLGLVYQPAKSVSVFVSYTNNFSPNTGVDTLNNPLKPSIIDQAEFGVKSDIFNKALTINLTTYLIRNSDFALSVVNPPAAVPAARELVGEVTSKGVELDISTRSVKGFVLLAGYSYNDTRYTKSNGHNSSVRAGDRLKYNPSHTANASLHYSFSSVSRLHGFSIGIGSFYTGNRLAGRNTTNSNPGYKLMAIPDYVLMDFFAGYAAGKYALRLKLSNLTNTLSYNVHDDNSVNPIAPRQLSASVSYKL